MDTKSRLVELSKGVLVERDVLQIAERITEYDPNLYLQYLDPRLADFSEAPYRVVEKCKDGLDRIVFYVWKLDASVLDRIRAADTQRGTLLESIDKQNLLAKKEMIRRYQDRMDAAADIVRHVVASPKSRYSFPTENEKGIVTVSDNKPVEVKER